MFRMKPCIYDDQHLASRPASKLEDHNLSAVREFLFNIFAASRHTGVRSSIRKLTARRDSAVFTERG